MNQPKRPAAPSGKPKVGNGSAAPKSQVPPRGGKGRPKPGTRPRPSATRPSAKTAVGATKNPGGGGREGRGSGSSSGVKAPGWERRRQQHQRRKIVGIAVAVAVAATVISVVVVKVISGSGSGGPASGPVGPEGVTLETGPALAPATSTVSGAPTAGVSCGATEQVATHIHAHLAVYVAGQPRSIPASVGITKNCLYYLHTHAADGIVHVEAPGGRKFVLGQFFAVWGQPLADGRVGPATGNVTAFVNGHRWSGPLEDIPLASHESIQLDIGSPVVPPRRVHLPSSL